MKIVALFFFFSLGVGHAQPIVLGKWNTVDDATGKVKAVVEILERNGLFYGRVLKVVDDENPDPVCDKCPADDQRYGKKIVGMEIIKDMKRDGDAYSEGSILDPEEGKSLSVQFLVGGQKPYGQGLLGAILSNPNLAKINVNNEYSNGKIRKLK